MSSEREAARDATIPDEASGLKIRLFGPMDVHLGTHALPRVPTRKTIWLLALLALRAERDIDRDFLAGTLWPETDEANSRRSLRQNLHHLRLALGTEGGRVSSNSPRSLRLDVSVGDVDALAFDHAVARGDTASLEAAVGLYRGPLLEDCAEEWVVPERAAREQAYLRALHALAADAFARRDHPRAVELIRRAVAVDGLREDLQRDLMKALAAVGDMAGAQQVYRDFRSLLWREMSLAPAEATSELYHSLRTDARRTRTAEPVKFADGAGSRRAPAPLEERRLPFPPTGLIGREEVVDEVLVLLARKRLVTLTGTGGIGKTRLAIEIAGHLADQFEEGARLADLAPLGEDALLVDVIRTSIGLPSTDDLQDPVESLAQQLSSRQLLLVLDNCEHLLGACGRLCAALLTHCPGLRILATSRQPLGIRGEAILRVPSLLVEIVNPSSVTPHPSPVFPACSPAVRLFVERACAADSSFEMTFRNAPAIADICLRLDGIPLAIELVASRVRALPVEEISERLHRGYGLAAAAGADLHPRHQTLAASFQWSWELLAESERALLRRLSVFTGGWTLKAAEAACAGSGLPAERILDGLTGLIDGALVTCSPAAGPAGAQEAFRYRLLETIRQFAADHLRESGELTSTQSAHRDYFLKWAEEVFPKLQSPEQALWFRRMEAEHDNLRAAVEACRSRSTPGDLEKEFRLVRVLSRFWGTHGHMRENRTQLEATIGRMSPTLAGGLRANVLAAAGWCAFAQGDHGVAREHYGRALAIHRADGDRARTAVTLNYLACAVKSAGDLAAAKLIFEESIAIHRDLERPGSLASSLNNLGDLALLAGDIGTADACLAEAASLCAAVGGGSQLGGIVRANQAIAAYQRGNYDSAHEHASKALILFHKHGALVEIPDTLGILGLVAARRQDLECAAWLLAAAASLAEMQGVSPQLFLQRERIRVEEELVVLLGASSFRGLHEEGNAASIERAVAYALESTQPC